MTLHQKQVLFSDIFARLVLKASDFGYEAVIDAVARKGDPRCHGFRLAGDLLLFKDGKYIVDGNDSSYFKLGQWWKQQHELCRWGGDFNNCDSNHFSLTHAGKA